MPDVGGRTEQAAEDGAGAIMGDMVTATAITGDIDMAGGVILTGGVILIGGTTLTIPTMVLTTMRAMWSRRRCFHRGLHLRQNRDNSHLPFGTSVRTQRVTTLTLKIARVVG